MKPATTIRSHLEAYLYTQQMSINQFSIQSGINSGTLSRLLSGQQPIAMNHLKLITRGMGLPEDYFYSMYVDECFLYSAPTWRRLRPFILNSAELGRLDCIELVVKNLLDNLIYAPMLFEVAEGLFHEHQWEAAAVLYKNVSTSEKYQHSERLAICQYRLFRIAVGDSQTLNLQAALLFECYIDRLEVMDQLEGLKHLMHVYYSLHKWDKVDELAQEMHRLAKLSYRHLHRSERKDKHDKSPEKPLFFYVLYSHLMRASVCEEHRDYESALKYVSLYMDKSWILENGEEDRRILEQFQEWGTANTLLYRMMSGDYGVLPEYVAYIAPHANEIFVALYHIMISANRFSWNVDEILEQFPSYIPYRTNLRDFGLLHNQQILADQYSTFLAELALYFLRHQRQEGIGFLLQSLETSAKIKSESIIIKCVNLFEQFRQQASEDQTEQYKLLIGEVQESNDKKIDHASSFV
ncbi:transcriptional regulator [Paenibacillus tritici]|uniref:Transcriptional regulator n=1 Tax=Paenibacillus tritici TaxID=1873425 RepID=A0ABX2DVC3_9BACL|nr:transcriptional regulator [Paenibacillus tritici]NQX48656.1 transcriptional regulator [Paenibacillus tritici]